MELLSDVAYFVLTTLSGNFLCHLSFFYRFSQHLEAEGAVLRLLVLVIPS